jgi:E3 ubiquitin-protein ligase CHFR
MSITSSSEKIQIAEYIQSQPRGFAPLIELDLFNDVHGVPAGPEPSPEAPRNSICRICATEVLLWGLRDWWIRERKKGFVEDSRKDCPDGSACDRRKDNGISIQFSFMTF